MKAVIMVCLIVVCLCNAVNIHLILKRIDKLEVQSERFKINLIGLIHQNDIRKTVKEYTNEKMSD